MMDTNKSLAPYEGRNLGRIVNKTEELNREFQEFFTNSPLESQIVSIDGKLGEGRHSKVYLGTQVVTNQLVCIKIDERAQFQDDFEIHQKIQALQELKHPRISKLLNYLRDEPHQRSYIIMEYIEGKSLSQALAEGERFTQAQVLDWGCQILEALSYLHKTGHIHGDIKLSNIVRKYDGSICLADFSYIVDDPPDEQEVESNNPTDSSYELLDIFGVLKDGRHFQRETLRDIYRVGSVLFQLLTGILPKKETSARKKKAQLLANEKVSPVVADVIVKALSVNPQERYQSAEEMLYALYDLPKRDPRARRRMWWTLAAVFLLSLSTLIGLWMYRVGQYQVSRATNMELRASESVQALQQGDYTKALDDALEAVHLHLFDPPCIASAQSALTTVLSAYQFQPGYQPLHSGAALRGKPINACFSPDGERVAVLTEDTDAVPSVRRVQIYASEDGRQIGNSFLADDSPASKFVFLNNDTLLFAGKNALTAIDIPTQKILWRGHPASEVALSADGQIAASIWEEEAKAYVYHTDTGKFYPVSFAGNHQLSAQNETTSNSDGNLLALNQNGTYMAVSFFRDGAGGLRLYRFPSAGEPGDSPESFDLLPASEYTHFEGGFIDSYFCYAGSVVQSGNIVKSILCVYELSERKEPTQILSRVVYERTPVHAQVDQNGGYFSIGAQLWRLYPEKQTWQNFADADGSIVLLRHIPNRVFSMTQEGTVAIADDNGRKIQSISGGAHFDIAALSERYLLLANQDRQMLSVLRWSESGTPAFTYDEMYTHMNFRISEEGRIAILFRKNEEIAQIYNADGFLHAINVEDWENIWKLEYLAAADAPARVGTDCLKLTYSDKIVYYRATDGRKVEVVEGRTNPNDTRSVIQTQDYVVSYLPRGEIEIFQRDSGNLISRLEEGKLIDASQNGERLLISLQDSKGDVQSVLLNRNMETIAKIPGACVALSDGTLYFDDYEGNIWQGRIFPLEELERMGMERRAEQSRLSGWRDETG